MIRAGGDTCPVRVRLKIFDPLPVNSVSSLGRCARLLSTKSLFTLSALVNRGWIACRTPLQLVGLDGRWCVHDHGLAQEM